MNDHDEYRHFTGKSEAHKAFNTLRGIIKGISIDKRINDREIKELELWCDKHDFLSRKNPFKDLITNIQIIISDNIVSQEEIEDMEWLCNKFSDGFTYYDNNTSDLQRLQGICHGILSDGDIENEEISELYQWLLEHEHLETYYPFDELVSIVQEILEDDSVTDAERQLLKTYISEFVTLTNSELKEKIDKELIKTPIGGICTKVKDLIIEGNTFCFTGSSSRASRSEIAQIIQMHGGEFSNSVAKSIDYLIVGDDGNPCWAYACYGRKVEKALQLRKSGAPIQIIHENDFWKSVG